MPPVWPREIRSYQYPGSVALRPALSYVAAQQYLEPRHEFHPDFLDSFVTIHSLDHGHSELCLWANRADEPRTKITIKSSHPHCAVSSPQGRIYFSRNTGQIECLEGELTRCCPDFPQETVTSLSTYKSYLIACGSRTVAVSHQPPVPAKADLYLTPAGGDVQINIHTARVIRSADDKIYLQVVGVTSSRALWAVTASWEDIHASTPTWTTLAQAGEASPSITTNAVESVEWHPSGHVGWKHAVEKVDDVAADGTIVFHDADQKCWRLDLVARRVHRLYGIPGEANYVSGGDKSSSFHLKWRAGAVILDRSYVVEVEEIDMDRHLEHKRRFDQIFKDYEFLSTALEHRAECAILGRMTDPNYWVLFANDRNGDLRFERQKFIDSLHEHDPIQRNDVEIRLKTGLVLNVHSIFRNRESCAVDVRQLFWHENQVLSTEYLLWEDVEHGPRKVPQKQMKGSLLETGLRARDDPQFFCNMSLESYGGKMIAVAISPQ